MVKVFWPRDRFFVRFPSEFSLCLPRRCEIAVEKAERWGREEKERRKKKGKRERKEKKKRSRITRMIIGAGSDGI